jgi:hypothetical protein
MFVNLVDLQNTFLIKFLQNCVSQKAWIYGAYCIYTFGLSLCSVLIFQRYKVETISKMRKF